MELALQFGWGMMAHSRSLVDAWGGGTVIMSPRDLSGDQLARLARDLKRAGGSPVLDPQFYVPHADHERLCAHDYWPSEFEPDHQLLPAQWNHMLVRLAALNDRLGCGVVVLPGVIATSNDDMDTWLEQHETMLGEAQRLRLLDRPVWLTIALAEDLVSREDSCDAILEWLEAWPERDIYLVMERPAGSYLTDNPAWLTGALELVGGLRLQHRRVVVGYANQQLLLLGCAGANAIASGTWLNVRSFSPEKFRQNIDEEMKQRKKWYYAPRTLSEYAIPYVDSASKRGVLDLMRPSGSHLNSYSAALFAAAQPSTARFSEADAFLHYLHCIRQQAQVFDGLTFDQSVGVAREMLDESEATVGELSRLEIRGQTREFGPDITQACRTALATFEADLGPRLRRAWQSLPA
jgi:hypothetical protein